MDVAKPVKGLTLEIPTMWTLVAHTARSKLEIRSGDNGESNLAHHILVIDLTEDVDITFRSCATTVPTTSPTTVAPTTGEPTLWPTTGDPFLDDVEYAWMLTGEVGTPGHMGSDPTWQAYGSDKEEDRSSMTTVGDSFRFDYSLGYNIYALAFDIPVNANLGYQYAYTTIRYRTQMERTAADLSLNGKTHLSTWMRCVGCSNNVIVKVKISVSGLSGRWQRSLRTAGVVGPEWTNYKLFFEDHHMAAVESFDFIIEESANGVLELTHISGSTAEPYALGPPSLKP